MWLAIAAAVIPLLAVPLWLMKTAVIAVALMMAGTTYSIIHQSDSRTETAQAEQKHIAAGFHSQTVSAEADESVDVKAESDQSTEGAPNRSSDVHGSRQDEQERNPQSSQEPEELTEDELKRQFFNTKDKPASDQGNTDKTQTEDSGPVNVTDPNSDRFIAVNTYKSRSNRLRS